MHTFLLGACLAAALAAPALAQPYDQGGYQDPQAQDQSGQYRGDQGQPDRSYQDDRGYQTDRGYRDDRGYNGDDEDQGGLTRDDGRVPPGAHYTRRIGSSWRDADGRDCAWRQLTWQRPDGDPAYKWVARCRD
jgi:hypothetical protein